MNMENFPGCCTSAILYSFGEHGEKSELNAKHLSEHDKIEAIKKMVDQELGVVDQGGVERHGHKRCVFAISVDPVNIRRLLHAGFNIVDHYPGIQGEVHIMTFHAS